jgi:hypothetical protein
MNNRPLIITLISLLFIIAGASGIYYHLNDFNDFNSEAALVFFIRLIAIAGGVLVFLGYNWGRWLLIVWMTYHVGLSFFHSGLEIAIHLGFLAITVLALFNKQASGYFKK